MGKKRTPPKSSQKTFASSAPAVTVRRPTWAVIGLLAEQGRWDEAVAALGSREADRLLTECFARWSGQPELGSLANELRR
jgi:hypothetical protein